MYLKNRSPSKAIKGKTPYEIRTNQRVDLRHLRVFGKAYMHIEKQQITNSIKRRENVIYFYEIYCLHSKGYRLIDLR